MLLCGLLPRQRMLYVADNAYAPYGKRTDAEVYDRGRRLTEYLLGAGARLIVVACNTATSVAIDGLREEYPEVPFVGLEPAVKPAATGERIGVMATAVTLRSPRYLALKDRYLAGRPVWENPCIGLVPLIEAYPPDHPAIVEYLRELFRAAGKPDTLVLGCTHYPLIAETIRTVAGSGVRVIDPSPAAARQVKRLVVPGLEVAGLALPQYDFVCTGAPAPLHRTLLRLPALNARRRWLLPYLTTPEPHLA